ncbi:hypothetical protein T552_00646 [Pneumocystis carinii B80]|uniref:RRM domain-containing protein n=1 Tax=Pneumocystis carinii (strain B80) TaxID=1408658 RepID=A0A0W4ZP59_PNEC8|nr:hypothetical protein T552_00646 [Pneumocystis carinii B80]KTW30169.1 hypothetical protein T552_00646 [Pneumocystis carinii B80]
MASYNQSYPYYGQNSSSQMYQMIPQIHNPFQRPGQLNFFMTPEEAAIAEQQSIYSSENRENAKLRHQARWQGKEKRITVLREGGGSVWEDPSLLDWNPAHFRLFAGDLGGEVSDETLFKAFQQYKSLSKAKVIRDKKTGKSKGYGFVAFKDPDEFVRAWREMNGKYIGSHPVKLRKANTEIRAVSIHQEKLEQKKRASRYEQEKIQSGRISKKTKIKR